MTIRPRLTLWYCGILFVGLLLIAAWTYYEMFTEHLTGPFQEALKAAGETPLQEIMEVIAYGVLPAFLLVLVGGSFLMQRAFAPVRRLTESIEKVSAESLGKQLARTHSGDELDRLTEVFNDMTARLDNAFQRVREFTLHASHELKTPLTVMSGELETALREERLSAQERERLASLLEEVQRLAHIVEGLTFLTKADAGLARLEREKVELDELVRDAAADAQVLASSARVRVRLEKCDRASVLGDRDRLRQLLLILTDNAVKYSGTEGTVALSLTQQNGQARLAVRNTGPCIPPEVLPRVFGRFFRGDTSHSDHVEGCGLGLSIAQSIVTAHEGEIRIASENQETVVTVLLEAIEPGSPRKPEREVGAVA